MKIMFLGAPGAGKGTRAEIAAKILQIPIIATGDIIRQAVAEKTPLGNQADAFLKEGALVPDEVVTGIVKERLQKPDCEKGFILDGFPRTVPQAEALSKMGIALDLVISVAAPDELIVGRLAGRRVCPACGASYHTQDLPPKEEGVCDRCGGALQTRRDDNPETVRKRLAVYHKETEPLMEFYRAKGRFAEIDGTDIGASAQALRRLLGDIV